MYPSTLALIHAAIAEDVGTGDVTSEYFIPAESRSRAQIVAREPGVVSGMEVAQALINSNGYLEVFLKEGRAADRLKVERGQRIELC